MHGSVYVAAESLSFLLPIHPTWRFTLFARTCSKDCPMLGCPFAENALVSRDDIDWMEKFSPRENVRSLEADSLQNLRNQRRQKGADELLFGLDRRSGSRRDGPGT